jgi:hypothetical protein
MSNCKSELAHPIVAGVFKHPLLADGSAVRPRKLDRFQVIPLKTEFNLRPNFILHTTPGRIIGPVVSDESLQISIPVGLQSWCSRGAYNHAFNLYLNT